MTRRQFARRVAGASAALLGMGAAGAGKWVQVKHKRQFKNATRPDVAGTNSLAVSAAAKGLEYGAAVKPLWLDLESLKKGHTEDASTWLKTWWLFNHFDKRGLWVKFVEGLRQRPLPFDDDFAPKAAFWAMREALQGRKAGNGETWERAGKPAGWCVQGVEGRLF